MECVFRSRQAPANDRARRRGRARAAPVHRSDARRTDCLSARQPLGRARLRGRSDADDDVDGLRLRCPPPVLLRAGRRLSRLRHAAAFPRLARPAPRARRRGWRVAARLVLALHACRDDRRVLLGRRSSPCRLAGGACDSTARSCGCPCSAARARRASRRRLASAARSATRRRRRTSRSSTSSHLPMSTRTPRRRRFRRHRRRSPTTSTSRCR